MASIFDDLRDKGSGLLNDFNDFLFKDRSSNAFSGSIDTSMQEGTGIPDTRTFSQAFKQGTGFGSNDPSVLRDTAPVTPRAKTNALVPPPQDKGSNLFLGAVGDYYREAQKTWKDKGGFDALMSNPQFGIGLSLLQQASEGKTIGASALKAMVDGGIISETYAKKIAARGSVTGPATAQQIEAVKAKLAASGLGGRPSWLQQLFDIGKGESTTAKQDMAYGEIYKLAEKKAKAVAKTGKEANIDDFLEEAAKEYITSGKGQIGRAGIGISGERAITKRTDEFREKAISGKRELGGPVTKDKAYLVGEVGPEVFIPKVSGKIVSNDDSKIINLLLEANPNLKNVSPARAEKILRNRFPDYFE